MSRPLPRKPLQMTPARPPETLKGGFDPGDLSFRGFQVFLAVAESGSISTAARLLGLSPASVSQQVTNLEKTVGARLFDRTARPIVPTPAGTLMRHHATHIMEAVNAAHTDLMEFSLSSNPQLRLAVIDDLDATVTPEIIDHLSRLYPSCLFSTVSGRSDTMTDMMMRREADIAITGMPPEDPIAYDTHPLMREQFVLVVARDALGATDNDPPGLDRLKKLPFVHYSTSMPIGRRIAQHMKRLKIDLPQKYAFDATRSVFAMVCNRRGWAITTPLCFLDSERFWPDLELKPLPFAGFSRTIQLAARRGEFGHLPQRLAEETRKLIETRVAGRFERLMPAMQNAITVLHPADGVGPDQTA